MPEEVRDLQDLIYAIDKQGLHFFAIGGGSNTLLGDVKKIILISDRKLPKKLFVTGNEVIVSANYNINDLMMKLLEYNLGDLDFLAGIPAHLGGIIKMNAGAYGKSISEFVKWIAIIDPTGKRKIIENDKLGFDYRYCNIDGFIYEVCLILPSIDKNISKKKIKDNCFFRKENQPISFPNLGCFFKNPENESAGKLIDLCGLKGKRIGGAEVSKKHANFIINRDNATFADTIALMQFVQQKVEERFNIKLEKEIEVIGE